MEVSVDQPGLKPNDSQMPPQVKICGLTSLDEAEACAALGADAIGFIFYPPSPRFITEERAAEIGRRLGADTCLVGVWVDAGYSEIMRKVEKCRLKGVQLHGQEPPELCRKLARQGLIVIKSLFLKRAPRLDAASLYNPSAFLVECGAGTLPGGNAMVWDWGAARHLHGEKPLIVAGGLCAENVSSAIESARPDAVDVSSGVEAAPGNKDLEKVKRFLETVKNSGHWGKVEKVFS